MVLKELKDLGKTACMLLLSSIMTHMHIAMFNSVFTLLHITSISPYKHILLQLLPVTLSSVYNVPLM